MIFTSSNRYGKSLSALCHNVFKCRKNEYLWSKGLINGHLCRITNLPLTGFILHVPHLLLFMILFFPAHFNNLTFDLWYTGSCWWRLSSAGWTFYVSIKGDSSWNRAKRNRNCQVIIKLFKIWREREQKTYFFFKVLEVFILHIPSYCYNHKCLQDTDPVMSQ